MSNEKLSIKIKYHTDITALEKYDNGDWIDLRAAEDVEVNDDYRGGFGSSGKE